MIAHALNSIVDAVLSSRAAGSSRRDPWKQAGYRVQKVLSRTGVVVDEHRAMALSAVWCATRAISEGVAMLPLNIREHIDDRTTRTAYDHALWPLLHDQPNPEQDKFEWFDRQVPGQVNGGHAYAEIQRDIDGTIKALWPIAHNRVRRLRGPQMDSYGEVVGKAREIVYEVRADGGASYLLAANEMLDVAGVAGGKGLVMAAAEALGIVIATEEHVESFYANGASPDIVISFKGSIPEEEKQNLRQSWSQRHAGARNAHKMLLMGGEPAVEQMGFSARDSLLIDGRKFNIAEVSRFWRVPMHFLSELDRATMNNIEILGIDWLVYCLGPWLQRWEMALKRQLLTDEEKQKYSFKFNVNALLRGDSASRSQFYQRLFDMGMLSINEGRELEDMNPIDGGDRYFILANNRVPLDRIDDIALLNTEAGKEASAESSSNRDKVAYAIRGVLATTLGGLVGYESRAVTQKAEHADFGAWCKGFYEGKFRETFTSQVCPLIESALSFGVTVTPEQMVREHVDAHCSCLVGLHESMQDRPMREFVNRVEVTVAEWAAGAAQAADRAFAVVIPKEEGDIQ